MLSELHALTSQNFLDDLALVLCVAAITTVIFQALRQPVVVGYLVAGMIVGPHVPIPILVSHQRIDQLSSLGVILLMFAIGLEFRVRSLVRLLPTAGFITIVQVGFLLWLGYVAGRGLGWSVIESLFAGAMIAISSTTIIAKAFAEQKVEKPLADLVIGVALFEDLVAVILLAVLTAIAAGSGLSARMVGITICRLTLFLAAIVAGGLLLVPGTIRLIARLKRKETLVVASVGICFAFAMINEAAGYSVALGAFLAGVFVAESGHAGEIEELAAPLRDIFGAVFFVSVGMMFDPKVIVTLWPALLVLLGTVLLGKIVGVTTGAILIGNGTRTGVRAGMAMAQIGEFSFIIVTAGLASGATHDYLYSLAIAAAAITTFLTPFMIRASDRVGRFVGELSPRPLILMQSLYDAWMERVRAHPSRVRIWRGVGVILGSSALIVIIAAIYETAALRLDAVVAADIGIKALPAVILIRTAAIALAIPPSVAIWRAAGHIAGTVASGLTASDRTSDDAEMSAVPSHILELGIIFAALLLLLAAIAPFIRPTETFAILLLGAVIIATLIWRAARATQRHLEEVSRHLTAMHLACDCAGDDDFSRGGSPLIPIRLPENAAVIGKSLAELNLLDSRGAAIVGLSRDGSLIIPEQNEVLRAGDTLALVGRRDALAAARALLEAHGQAFQTSA
jgi:monovalent cation:H+ antiporter-2, CPA2 family